MEQFISVTLIMTSHFALPLFLDLPPSLSTAVTGGCLKMKKKVVRL